jgi:hypothetical protein
LQRKSRDKGSSMLILNFFFNKCKTKRKDRI